MKEIRFAITTEFPFSRTRDYLIAWSGNVTYDSPDGLTWTSWEYFRKCNKEILANKNLGISTIFKTYADAEAFAKEFDIKSYKIIEILFDTRISETDAKLAEMKERKNYAEPGISPEALKALM